MNPCLLVLIVTPAIEDAVVDWLLERDDIPGFSSAAVNGHGASIHSLSPSEQVAGRQRNIMFQIQLPESAARTLVEEVRDAFRGSGMHYWISPVLAAGHIE